MLFSPKKKHPISSPLLGSTIPWRGNGKCLARYAAHSETRLHTFKQSLLMLVCAKKSSFCKQDKTLPRDTCGKRREAELASAQKPTNPHPQPERGTRTGHGTRFFAFFSAQFSSESCGAVVFSQHFSKKTFPHNRCFSRQRHRHRFFTAVLFDGCSDS